MPAGIPSLRPTEIETEQGSSLQEVPCRAHDHVSIILRPKREALHESDVRRRDFEFPTELRIAVMRDRTPINDPDLAADFTGRMGDGVQINVSAALAQAFHQFANGVREAGSCDYVRVVQDSAGNQVAGFKIHARRGLE